MARLVSVNCSVYGASDGIVAFLDAPEGVTPPPRIAHLAYLGPPYDVVTGAVNRLHAQHRAAGRRASPQRALAEMLGTIQQDVSRWVNAQCAPRLNDHQWAQLICFVLAGDDKEAQA